MMKLFAIGIFVFGSLVLAQAQNTPSQAPNPTAPQSEVLPGPGSPNIRTTDNDTQNHENPSVKHIHPKDGQRKEEQPNVNTPSNSNKVSTGTRVSNTTPAHTQPVKQTDTGTAPKN